MSLLQYLILFVTLYFMGTGVVSQENQPICAILTSMPLLKTQYSCQCSILVPSCSLCSYYLQCNNPPLNVTSFNLYGTDVSGTIPTQIGQLLSLTKINLDSTSISGTIPTQIGLLASLTSLDFGSTQISGKIPTQIGQLASLNYIKFYKTQIGSTIPTQIGQLTSLTTLILDSSNLISGIIPTQIGLLTSLYNLDFGITQISGNIPKQIGQLASLTYLTFYATQINGTIPTQIGQLLSLVSLNFHSTQISGTIPTQIGLLASLSSLDFGSSQISGTIPTQIGQLVSLNYLDFGSTQISGTIPTQIGLLVSLTYVDLSSTDISGNIPQLRNLANLAHLNLLATNTCGCPNLPTEILSCMNEYCSCQYQMCPLGLITCNNIYQCPEENIPVPQPSPYIGHVPLPSSSPVPLPVPNGNIPLPSSSPVPLPVPKGNIPLPSSSPVPQSVPNVGNKSIPASDESTLSVPQSVPDVGHVPLPSSSPVLQSVPNVGHVPLPSSSPVLQSVPDDDCIGYIDNNELFICKNGNWTSNSDVTLNGTNVLNGKFNFPSLFIEGNVTIQGSNINLQKNLLVQKHSIMTLIDSNITVNGDLVIQSGSTLILGNVDSNHFPMNVNQNALLNGISLIVNDANPSENQRLSILSAKVINGTFISVSMNLANALLPSCNNVSARAEQVQAESHCYLFVIFSIENQCSLGLPVWIYVVTGVCFFLLMAGIITAAYVIMHRNEELEKELIGYSTKVIKSKE